jgi:hypothetical protein
MPKKPKQTKSKPEAAKSATQDLYDLSHNYLRDEIEAIVNGTAAKTKHDPAYRVATLTRMAAQVDAERRKARAHDEKKLEKITLPLVLAWLRQARDEELRSVAREVAAIMGQEGNLLA